MGEPNLPVQSVSGQLTSGWGISTGLNASDSGSGSIRQASVLISSPRFTLYSFHKAADRTLLGLEPESSISHRQENNDRAKAFNTRRPIQLAYLTLEAEWRKLCIEDCFMEDLEE